MKLSESETPRSRTISFLSISMPEGVVYVVSSFWNGRCSTRFMFAGGWYIFVKFHIIRFRPIDNVVQIRLEDFGIFCELYFTRDSSIISEATGWGILYCKLQVFELYQEDCGAKDCAGCP